MRSNRRAGSELLPHVGLRLPKGTGEMSDGVRKSPVRPRKRLK